MADEYVCIRKCWHRGKVWQKGDAYNPLAGEEVPHHFAKKGTPVPEDATPRLGTKVSGKTKPLPSLKAPGKKDLTEE